MKSKIEELERKIAELNEEYCRILRKSINELRENRYPPKSAHMDLWTTIKEKVYVRDLEFDKSYFIFAALVETCKEWNQIDGFVPDCTKYGVKISVINDANEIAIKGGYYRNRPLVFESIRTANLFLDKYRTELEQVKHLL